MVDRLRIFRIIGQLVLFFFILVSVSALKTSIFDQAVMDRPTIIAGLGYKGPAAQLHTG
jgi:hypothetical protein